MVKKDKKEEVTPLVMIQDIEIKGVKVPEGMKKVFVSYSVMDLATGQMGFGNTCSLFNQEAYNPDNLEEFINRLQLQVAEAIKQKTGQSVTVQVLFFR